MVDTPSNLGGSVGKLTGELGAGSAPEGNVGGGLLKSAGGFGKTFTETPVGSMEGVGKLVVSGESIGYTAGAGQLATSLGNTAGGNGLSVIGLTNNNSSNRDVNAEMQKAYDDKQAQQARDNQTRQEQQRSQQNSGPPPPSFCDI